MDRGGGLTYGSGGGEGDHGGDMSDQGTQVVKRVYGAPPPGPFESPVPS